MASLDNGNITTPGDVLTLLPNGASFVTSRPYTDSESRGVLILVIVSCISATAVTGLLLAIAISAFNTRKSTSPNLFVRSHVALYFISLLLCEVAQTVGSIMNMRWVNERAVSYEPYCTAQGSIKHLSDVGTAFWSMIIALNTFWIVFLRWNVNRYVLIAAMVGGWCAIGALVSAGPISISKSSNGPFYAISGYWCWISDHYASERITLDYMIMFLSALFSFIMYTLVFLRLRGNVYMYGWSLTVSFRRDKNGSAPKSVDTHAVNIAKGMLLYPVAYTILLLPIAVCRFAEWTGNEVPFAATIFSDAVFLLSGFVNVVLFVATRRVLPMYSVIPRSVWEMFTRPPMPASDRDSTYTTSSYATDLEKKEYDEQSDVSHSSGPPLPVLLSAGPTIYIGPPLPSAARTPYIVTSPARTPYIARSPALPSPASSQYSPASPALSTLSSTQYVATSPRLSALPSAARPHYVPASPTFSIRSEDPEADDVPSASPEDRTFAQEADDTIPPYPYSPGYWLSPDDSESPPLSVQIPSSGFSPSFPSPLASDRGAPATSASTFGRT